MTHIELRPFTREEYHEFFRGYVPDPMMDPHPYHYQQTHIDRNFDYDESRRDWYPTFGIFADETIVGTLSLKRIDRVNHKCEIGLMMMNDACKNHGYGTAAMQLAMEKAQVEYGVKSIWADTMGSNTRMQHILSKLGFRLVERIERIYDMPHGKEDRLVYCWEADE